MAHAKARLSLLAPAEARYQAFLAQVRRAARGEVGVHKPQATPIHLLTVAKAAEALRPTHPTLALELLEGLWDEEAAP